MKAPAQNAAEKSSPETRTVTARGAHHRVWQRDNFMTLADGRVVNRPSGYTELATGLHYFENGAWQESRAEIEITPEGAAALHGPHQVLFAGNLNTRGAIALTTPDQKILRSHILGLAYTDSTTGESIFLGRVRDADGLFYAPNEVLYPDAFNGVQADVRYTYTRQGFEQDVILRAQLPTPASLGLRPETTLLEVWTEFVEAPVPVVRSAPGRGLRDQSLEFGTVRILRGGAFALDAPVNRRSAAPVFKQWIQAGAQKYLIESVPYSMIRTELEKLPPPQAGLKLPDHDRTSRLALLQQIKPHEIRPAKPVRLALPSEPLDRRQGLVLDYVLYQGEATNFTFQADTTYLLTDGFNVYGTTTFEGGTVVKYNTTNGVILQTWDNVVCATDEYHPAIFTSRNDRTVGEDTYDGTPMRYVGAIATALPDLEFKHLKISHADYGLHTYSTKVRHAQFVHCGAALYTEFTIFGEEYGFGSGFGEFDNVLFYDVERAFAGAYYSNIVRHATVNQCGSLTDDWSHDTDYPSAITFTNCLFANVTNFGFVTNLLFDAATVTNASGAAFQTVGAGANYLADGSTYRNVGTTNIPAALLVDLRKRTTWPPVVITNATLSTNLTLNPAVPRSTNAPDLGYHYTPLDYVFGSNVLTNATLTLNAGTALGTFTPGTNTQALLVERGASMVTRGEPTNLVHIARYNVVQEQAGATWSSTSPGASVRTATSGVAPSPSGRFSFTDWTQAAQDSTHFVSHSTNVGPFTFRDCQFYGGRLDNFGAALAFTNTLWFRVDAFLGNEAGTQTGRFYNNTLVGGQAIFNTDVGAAPPTWEFFNNAFATTSVAGGLAGLAHGYNAYLTPYNRLGVYASNDLVTNIVFQTGPLGRFYLTNNSPLLNAGNMTARPAGLYWYTTTTNQVAETNSVVDLGFHYVALDSVNAATAQPLDYDQNGIANYMEDFDGHFSLDAAEASLRGKSNLNLVAFESLGPSSRRTPLVISEIKYGSASNSQFIELFNTHHLAQVLDGFTLVEPEQGTVLYTFPSGTTVSPKSFIAAIPLSFQLLNEQRLQLRNARGAVLLELRYDNKTPWPKAADGSGHTLVLTRPAYGEADARSWSPSFGNFSTYLAGEATQTNLLSAVRINEILANPTNGQNQFVELFNAGGGSVNISGLSLSTSKTVLNQFVIPTNTVIPARGFLCFTQGVNTSLGLMKTNGDTVYFSSFSPMTRVLEAVSFDGQAPGISYGRFPDGADGFQELSLRTHKATNAPAFGRDIVISEIMFNPGRGALTNDFIEIYNRGANPQSLDRWGLAGTAFRFTNFTLGSSNYVVIAGRANNLLNFYTNLSLNVNLFGNYTPTGLKDSGQRIALTNAQGVVMDEVTYSDGGRWGRWTDGGGASLELVDLRSDNSRAASWADSAPPLSAPWTTLSVTGLVVNGDAVGNINRLEMMMLNAGECLVDDIEVREATGANLLGNGGFDGGGSLAAQGWTVEGNHDLSVATNGLGTSGSACLLVRATGRGDYLANRIRHGLSSSFAIGSTCVITAKVKWQRGHPELLFRLSGNYLEGVARMIVPGDLGTPGRANSVTMTNAGPALFDVQHHPAVPRSNELVTITVRAADPDGLQNLRVKFRSDPATNYSVLPMLDDGNTGGMSGDAVALDSVFTAVLPRLGVGNTAFLIEATDTLGALTRFPAEEVQYPGDRWKRECVVRIGEATNGSTFGSYRLWMTASNYTRWSTRGQAHNGPVDITFVNGDRCIYNAGARYAGSFAHSTFVSPLDECGYSLSFPGDEPFLGDSGLNLDYDASDSGHDNALTFQSEQLAMAIADRLELPNHHRRFVELYVHGTLLTGGLRAYEDTQGPNTDYLQQWFPYLVPDPVTSGELFGINYWLTNRRDFVAGQLTSFLPGTLIRSNRAEPGTTNTSLDIPRYRIMWEPHALQGRSENFSALSNLIAAVENPASPGYASNVQAQVDIEQWMRVSAFERALGNFDSYGWDNGQNMFGFHKTNALPVRDLGDYILRISITTTN